MDLFIIYENSQGALIGESRFCPGGKPASRDPLDFNLKDDCAVIAVFQRISFERCIVNGKEIFL